MSDKLDYLFIKALVKLLNTVDFLPNFFTLQQKMSTKQNDEQSNSSNPLVILMVSLIMIWLVCHYVQIQPQKNPIKSIIQNMNVHLIQKNQQVQNKENDKLRQALRIASAISQTQRKQAKQELDELIGQNYPERKPQKSICIIVDQYNPSSNFDDELKTAQSLIDQKYSSHRVIYLDKYDFWESQPQKITKYFMERYFPNYRYTYIPSPQFSVQNLYKASQLCNQESIMMFLKPSQQLISSNVLKLINLHFDHNQTSILWANTLFTKSLPTYQQQAQFQAKASQKPIIFSTPGPIQNSIFAFRNNLLINLKPTLIDKRIKSIDQVIQQLIINNQDKIEYQKDVLSVRNRKKSISRLRDFVTKEFLDYD